MSVSLEEPAPRRRGKAANAFAADGGIPEPVVVDVRGERRPHHQRRMEQQMLERAQRTATDELIAPDHEAATGLESHVGGSRLDVPDDLDVARIGDPEAPLVTHSQIRNL